MLDFENITLGIARVTPLTGHRIATLATVCKASQERYGSEIQAGQIENFADLLPKRVSLTPVLLP